MFKEASVVFSVQGLYFASTLYAIVPSYWHAWK